MGCLQVEHRERAARGEPGDDLAHLIAQDKAMSDLVEIEVPNRIVLNAPVVTSENVEKYLPTAFES